MSLCDLMDYTVHGILQARILGWVAFPFSRGSSQPEDQTQVSCIAGRFFTSWATSPPVGSSCWSSKHFSCFPAFALVTVSSIYLLASLHKQTILFPSFSEEKYTYCVSGPAWGKGDTVVNKTNTVPAFKEPWVIWRNSRHTTILPLFKQRLWQLL